MELTARVSQLLPLATGVSGAGNQWQKATVIVEWQEGQYTKKLALSNMKKAAEFINLLIGQEYTFKFDVTSREHNGKWYHDVNCYGWAPVAQAAPAPAPQPAPVVQPQPQQSYGNPYGAQPPYPQQSGAPAPQQYQPAAAQPAPAYNPAQPQYAAQPPQQDGAPF